MHRTWGVRPDETGIVSREALISAFIDAAALLDIAGGTLSVVTGRAATDLPGEMALNGVVLTWMDRTDAKPQPEAPSTVTTPAQPLPDDIEDKPMEFVEGLEAPGRDEPLPASPDGFDYSGLPDEDVEEATEAAR